MRFNKPGLPGIAAVLLITGNIAACSGDKPAAEEAVAAAKTAADNVEIKQEIALTKEQKVANSYLKLMDSMATALEDVTDEESAQKAAEEIRKVTEKMSALHKKYGDDLGEKKMAEITFSRKEEFTAVQQRVMKQMMRIGSTNPALMQTISDEMENMNFN